jgi:transposase
MTKPLSDDIRERLINAVAQGMSRRAAAARYDVAPSTVIRLFQHWHATGTIAPRPQGGDKRSGRIEAHAEVILALIAETVDITLAEIADLQKKPRTPASRSVLTLPANGKSGARASRISIRNGLSSLMKRVLRPK